MRIAILNPRQFRHGRALQGLIEKLDFHSIKNNMQNHVSTDAYVPNFNDHKDQNERICKQPFVPINLYHQPNTHANINGATIVASLLQ